MKTKEQRAIDYATRIDGTLADIKAYIVGATEQEEADDKTCAEAIKVARQDAIQDALNFWDEAQKNYAAYDVAREEFIKFMEGGGWKR